MKFLKKPFAAVLLSALIVFASTAISINLKLNNKCEDIINSFYYGVDNRGVPVKSIYYNLNELCGLADEIIIIAENYGIDTRELGSSLSILRMQTGYHNDDIDSIYEAYEAFYNSLFAVELELSSIGISQRHLEYMSSASQQIANLKQSIETSGYNESVRNFYKSFDRFPVNIFAELFDVDYPEQFA